MPSTCSPCTARMNRLTFRPRKRPYFDRCSNGCERIYDTERMCPVTSRMRSKVKKPRVADEIMAGIREIERMLDEGKTPEQMFTVKTVEIPDPGAYRAKHVRALREALGVSQAVFAHLLGVSVILVKSWERGAR